MQYILSLSDTSFVLLMIINILIIAFFAASWIIIVLKRNGDTFLTSSGLNNMKYYTVLSNMFEVIMSIVLIVCLIRVRSGKADSVPYAVFFLKYIATVCVTVTILVVILILLPLTHNPGLFKSSNFFLHLAIPVLAILEFLFLDKFGQISFPATLITVVPAIIYALGYLLNLLIHKNSSEISKLDFYGFLRWGISKGALIFAAVLIINWGSALLLRLGNLQIPSF